MNWFDNGVVRALGRLCDFVVLNILWIICSLPIITIGASTSAMYSVMLKIVKNEEGYIIRGFFKGFKENFKKSTILWLMLLAMGIIIRLDFQIIQGMNSSMRVVMQGILMFVSLMLVCLNLYGFPMLARYENTLRQTIKNSFILAIVKLPYTILMLIIVAAPIVITFLTAKLMVIGIAFWFLIGVAVVSWANSFILRRVFLIFQDV